ncbi:MAG: hypothetical protein MJ192_08660 [Clostridia bacterium]|nr:hypothetical protein [Clostridia bacterium]
MNEEQMEREAGSVQPVREGEAVTAEAALTDEGRSAPPSGTVADPGTGSAVSGTQEPAPSIPPAPDSGADNPSGERPDTDHGTETDTASADEVLSSHEASPGDTATWGVEARALREDYPAFDMEREMQDRTFRDLVSGAVRPTLRQAYELCHRAELTAAAVDTAVTAAVRQAEEDLLAHIRARGQRPAENGTTSAGAVQTHPSVDRLTRSDRADLARRAERGEHVRL